ncbi:MAG: hypothetical protein ACREA0_10890, partial [bacterium]
FSSNYAQAFGKLVTPLVQGIRVRGPFGPRFTNEEFNLVLIDGQGIGHAPDAASTVSTHITSRYGEADVILLVDNAEQPMLAPSVAFIRSVLASGHQRKLVLGLTHFDRLEGPNLRSIDQKRAHVLEAVTGAVDSLKETLGATLVNGFEEELANRCYMLGWLDRPITERSRGPVKGMERLLAFSRDSLLPEPLFEATPIYDPAGLLFAVQAATDEFHNLWNARLGYSFRSGVDKEHWARVKALNRRVALSIDVEYLHLQPVAELIARLSEQIAKFLNEPVRWGGPPADDREREQVIARVRRTVFSSLHALVEARIVNHPRPSWVDAYSYRGHRSTFERAREIRSIYEEAAPIPGPAMTKSVAEFLDEVRRLVHSAIIEAGGELESAVPVTEKGHALSSAG